MDPYSEWEQGVYDPGTFKLDRLQPMKLIFGKLGSNLLTCHIQHFPFPTYSDKGTPKWTTKVSGSKGCMSLGNSKCNICTVCILIILTVGAGLTDARHANVSGNRCFFSINWTEIG